MCDTIDHYLYLAMDLQHSFTLEIWSVISFIVAGQGFFLLFLIITKRKTHQLQSRLFLLTILIGSFSSMLIYYGLYWSNIHTRIHPIFSIPLSFIWIIGPIYYLLTSESKTIYRNHLYHFAPFIIFLLLRIASSFSITLLGFLNSIPLIWTILNISLLFQLTFYCLVISKKLSPWKKNQKWLLLLGLSFNIFALSNIIYYVLVWCNALKPALDYFISLVMAISIYGIGYYNHRSDTLKIKVRNEKKYAHSMLSPQAINSLTNKINKLIDEHKIYLQHDLNLESLSIEVGASKHQVSQIINEQFHCNFFDFINKHRIEYATRLLKESAQSEMKINQLAFKAGFNNKVTFSNAFKKFTGMTATAFRNSEKKVKY